MRRARFRNPRGKPPRIKIPPYRFRLDVRRYVYIRLNAVCQFYDIINFICDRRLAGDNLGRGESLPRGESEENPEGKWWAARVSAEGNSFHVRYKSYSALGFQFHPGECRRPLRGGGKSEGEARRAEERKLRGNHSMRGPPPACRRQRGGKGMTDRLGNIPKAPTPSFSGSGGREVM